MAKDSQVLYCISVYKSNFLLRPTVITCYYIHMIHNKNKNLANAYILMRTTYSGLAL